MIVYVIMPRVKETHFKLYEIGQVFGCGIQKMALENAHPLDFPQCGLCENHSETGREGEWNFGGGTEAQQVGERWLHM